jgi:phage terminase small subunit
MWTNLITTPLNGELQNAKIAMSREQNSNGLGAPIACNRTPYPVQSPYVAVANRQAEIMMRIASEFGFTPASRSRISTHPKAEPTLFDRLEDYPDEAAS